MTPDSDKKSSFAPKTREELLNTLGHPQATETEWLDACSQLGDYQPPQKRRRSAPRTIALCAMGTVAVTSVAYMGAGLIGLNRSHPPQQAAPVPPQAQENIDYGPYMAVLQRRIKRAWFPPKMDASKRVTTRFWVHRDGAINDVKISGSSGNAECDAAARRAVENAAPFQAFPPGAPEKLEVQFTFDYNIQTADHFSSSR